jgi:hypothetical protein
VNELIIAYLRENAQGVGSREIAERFLKFKSPDERLAHLTVKGLLGKDKRCELDAEGRWHAVAEQAAPGQPTLVELPWLAVNLHSSGRDIAHVSLWTVFPEPAPLIAEWLVDPAGLSPDDRDILRPVEGEPWDPARRDEILAQVADALAEAVPVFASGRDEGVLQAHCSRAGTPLGDNALLLSQLLRAAGVSVPRPLSLEGCYSALLGSRLPAVDAAAGAMPLAEVVAELVARLRHAGMETLEALQLKMDEEAAAFDFSGKEFTWETLTALRQAPGVYGFKNREGAYIYIGKATNTRRRVSGYFRPSEESPEKLTRLRAEAVSFTVHPCGSELESLLYEHRLILKYSPPLNTQTEVNERKGVYQPIDDCVVLLPHADQGKGMSVWFRRSQKIELHPFAVDFSEDAAIAAELEQFFFVDRLAPVFTDFAEQEIAFRWIRRHQDRLTIVPAGKMGTGREIVDAMRFAWREAGMG